MSWVGSGDVIKHDALGFNRSTAPEKEEQRTLHFFLNTLLPVYHFNFSPYPKLFLMPIPRVYNWIILGRNRWVPGSKRGKNASMGLGTGNLRLRQPNALQIFLTIMLISLGVVVHSI